MHLQGEPAEGNTAMLVILERQQPEAFTGRTRGGKYSNARCQQPEAFTMRTRGGKYSNARASTA